MLIFQKAIMMDDRSILKVLNEDIITKFGAKNAKIKKKIQLGFSSKIKVPTWLWTFIARLELENSSLNSSLLRRFSIWNLHNYNIFNNLLLKAKFFYSTQFWNIIPAFWNKCLANFKCRNKKKSLFLNWVVIQNLSWLCQNCLF